jgi:hypothetical protein
MIRAHKLRMAADFLRAKGYENPLQPISAGEVQRMLVEFNDELLASCGRIHDTAVAVLKPVEVEIVARTGRK